MTLSTLSDHIARISCRAIERYFGLPEEEAAELLKHLRVEEVQGGEWLFHENDSGDSMYLVVRGRLEIWTGGNASVRLGEIVPGECVGEVSLLTGETRSAGARAMRDTLLIKINPQQFSELAGAHPKMVVELASNVARRLHQNTRAGSPPPRVPKMLCLQTLHDTDTLTRISEKILEKFKSYGSVLEVSFNTLSATSAPQQPLSIHDQPSDMFCHWLSKQEDDHEFIIFRCSSTDDQWLEFVQRQSDWVLLLAEAQGRRPTELQLTNIRGRHIALALCHRDGRAIAGTRSWLDAYPFDFHVHIRGHRDGDIARTSRLLSGRATGLVLGGGAARGFAHLGIYKALIESGIDVDWVGGASIGAILGAAIAMDLSPAAAEVKARHAFVVGKPFGDFTLPIVSVLRGRRMTFLTQLHLPGHIEDLPIPFFAVSANINTAEVNIHDRDEIWRATNASAALPGVLPPVVYKSELAVDGAVLNNLPVDIMQQKPVGKIFAVELSSRESLLGELVSIPSPWMLMLQRFTFGVKKNVIPNLAALVLKSTEVSTRAKSKAMGAEADILFSPPVQSFSLLKVDAFDDIIEVGYQHALEKIAEYQAQQTALANDKRQP